MCTLYDCPTSPTAYQLLYMTLAVDITDGCRLSNEAHHWLLTAKEEQDNAVFAVHFIHYQQNGALQF